jgi:UDP-N-acetylglucosamine 2-epimerase (non-hydrolysing)
MLSVLTILGTRPEAIKMAPVIGELTRHPDEVISRVCVTAQHREMLDPVLALFGIVPHYDLNLMRERQSLAFLASAILASLDKIFAVERPDWVLVQGDTTTAVASSLAAFYAGVKVGHVEAGLRTKDKSAPFPEEVNRRLTTVLADMHFAPTERARTNLISEWIPPETIVLTGNTIVDALHHVADLPCDLSAGPLRSVPWEKHIILVTAHRRENFGAPLENICAALRELARKYQNHSHIVYSVHFNPHVWGPVHRMLSGVAGVTLVPPLDYLSLVHALKRSYLVLTDSGGLQEEAPSLGIPVLILRDVTERPEGVAAGTAKLVGTAYQAIVQATSRLLDDADAYRQMARPQSLYGDGHAAPRVTGALLATTAAAQPA